MNRNNPPPSITADLFQQMAESVVDILFTLDRDQRYTSVFGAILRRWGLGPELLLGRTPREILGEEAGEIHEEANLRALAGEEVRYEWSAHGSEGLLHFQTLLSPLRSRAGAITGVLGIGRDITALKQTEADLRQLVMINRLLHDLDERILRLEPMQQVIQHACDQVVTIFDSPLAWITLRQPDGTLRLMAKAGEVDQCLRHVQPLSIPLCTEEREIGAFAIYAPNGAPFPGSVREQIAWLAAQIGLTIMTARQQEQIHIQLTALRAAANAVVITDQKGTIRWVNPAFTGLTGYSRAEAFGQNLRLLKSGAQSEEFYREMWSTIMDGRVWQGRVVNRRKDGAHYVEEMTITPVREQTGQALYFIAVKEDVTERQRQQERIEFLANHDALTGLSNRRSLDERLREAVALAAGGHPAALLMVDLDNFKLVNDTAGHSAGDQLLISLSRQMSSAIRQADEIYRLGGDEFVILLAESTADDARAMAEQVRSVVDGCRFRWGENTFTVTASIGITLIDGTYTAEEVLAQSDAALYAAKNAGKNRVALHVRTTGRDAGLETFRWISRLREALADGDLVVHFQPVVRLDTGRIAHLEALVRLRDGERLVLPGEFIPTAERFGLMPELDRYIIRQALEQFRSVADLSLFLNLSGVTLSDESLPGFLKQEMARSGIDPARICFEVTETAALADLGRAQQRMRELKETGCRFALDDFGSGFASFGYLRSLPVDYVKLDGSFSQHLDSEPTNRALTRSVTQIAHALGKAVIAEQVERIADARLLRKLGVEYGQGYLFGRPAVYPGPRESARGVRSRSTLLAQ